MNAVKVSKIIRSNRKSISIQITPQGEVIVRAPKLAPKFYIDNLIQKKASWINKKLSELKQNSLLLNESDKKQKIFFFLGDKYRLIYSEEGKNRVSFKDNFILHPQKEKNAAKLMISWYKKHAKEIIIPRAQEISHLTGLKYKQIKITSAMSRWGSCNSKGTVCFPYRLIMTPPSVIDYVIIHELAHLAHLDHSPKFWAMVEKLYPNYKNSKKWLKKFGPYCTIKF